MIISTMQKTSEGKLREQIFAVGRREMGRGRLLKGEFKKESYPIERIPCPIHTSDLPALTCTLVKHTPDTTRRDLCTSFVQPRIHQYIPAPSCTAGARQAFALNPKHLPCFFYATHMLRATCMHSYVQILSHSHMPEHPCVLLHSHPLSSLLTYIHPLAYWWPHLAASHMLP